ncbi:MAG TPA: hypothetical protein VLF95_12905 [Vicinamibacteria bacterium]|nr:hypothetical protein [Vicinamibacteria bacterium]
MPVPLRSPAGQAAVSRPLVACLFVSSVLLSIVSWYTTQQGMALYLSSWFSFLASLGVQSALVLVAWLVGVTDSRRGILIAVYAVTAAVSIAFSYVSLHTWFASRERPATIERALYDELNAAAGKSQELVAAALAEGQKHALALEEMSRAEKAHGYVSRATDQDPYLARVREAVAREAASYGASYPEGEGPGLRYTAFDRHASLARQTVARLQETQKAIADFRAGLRPLAPTEQQLRAFRQVFDAIPWNDVRDTLHAPVELPPVPAYSDFVDRAATGQEDLVIAFTELVSAPTSRHVLAFALAAFIDLVVFLLAYAAGPIFFGAPEERWVRAGAALDSADEQVFARDLLRKVGPSAQGLARVDAGALSPGERQLVLLLASRGLAVPVEEEGGRFYLLDPSVHRTLAESLADRRLPLRASAAQPSAG